MERLPKLIAVVGPTASGKTALGIRIAEALAGRRGAGPAAEIVSADSRQIYRGMDIGTAKPDAAERAAAPHHLIDIRNPDEEYTVADYQRDAIGAIRDIVARGRVPILVGGTGLYVRAVIDHLDIPRAAPDPAIRAAIEKDIEAKGLAAVFAALVARDPEAAYVVDPHNPRRVVRALEVAIATGEPFTAQQRRRPPLFEPLELGINIPPDALRTRIAQRIDTMMRDGLVEEVRALVARYGDGIPALDAIGYREIVAFLRGGGTLDEAVARMKINTARYAKRQMTWFKKDHAIQWIASQEEALARANAFL